MEHNQISTISSQTERLQNSSHEFGLNWWSKEIPTSEFLNILVEIADRCMYIADLYLINNQYSILLDILHILGKLAMTRTWNYLFPYCHRMLKKNLLIKDAKLVKSGDILLTPDLKYVIVRKVYRSNTTKWNNRISVEIVHCSYQQFLASKRVSVDTYTLAAKSVVFVSKPSNPATSIKNEITKIAVGSVGDFISWQPHADFEISKFSRALYGLTARTWWRKLTTTNELEPGDIISFIYDGLYRKGILIKKQNSPDQYLTIDCCYINAEGIVSETKKEYNLDTNQVLKYGYTDLDSVIKNRMLYITECMKGKKASTNTLNFIHMCLSGDLPISRQLPVLILLQTTQYTVKAFQRIENIRTWMKDNLCLELPVAVKQNLFTIDFNPAVVILMNTDGTAENIQIFDESYTIKTKQEIVSSPSRGQERFEQTYNKYALSNKLLVAICALKLDENGRLSKEDEILLSLLKFDALKLDEVIFTIPKRACSENRDGRLNVSKQIQDLLDSSSVNTVFHRTFFKDEPDLQKRISVLLECRLNQNLKAYSDKLHAILKNNTKKNGIDENLNEYVAKLKTLNSLIHKEKPNVYDRHLLEVILQRNTEVSAVSFREGKLYIFTNKEESLKKYMKTFAPTKLDCEICLKPWFGTPKVKHYHLKQGSKVCQTNDPERGFGTLGLFLRDREGNIYFTTCAHVIGKDEETFTTESASVVGKSVYAPEKETLSITGSLDLSIIKVFEEKISSCLFGLRNPDDQLVEGTITEANDSEMNNMKVYKWGAKTNLTKGIYKGSLCIRKGEKFDNRIHYIQGTVNKNEFAKEGDSGSLICFEATGSPQLSGHTAAFIFVGECTSGKEYFQEDEVFSGFCYRVSNVFRCDVTRQLDELHACMTPSTNLGHIKQGSAICSETEL